MGKKIWQVTDEDSGLASIGSFESLGGNAILKQIDELSKEIDALNKKIKALSKKSHKEKK